MTSDLKSLLGRRISELKLTLKGTAIEQLVDRLYSELAAKRLAFRPPVYLSDEWGCPEGVPLIGIPFYLADPQLATIEEEVAIEVEGELDIMRYLRHEAGHAFNYAYRLYDRPEWREIFGPYSRPYQEHFRIDPVSTNYVRHIHAWYAQKHPDEDFAETFAVWLTPGIDWMQEYAGWKALAKLQYVERVMQEVGSMTPETPIPTEDHMPVDAMHYTLAEHYEGYQQRLPLEDERYFDGDLRIIFDVPDRTHPGTGRPAADFIRQIRRELIRRIAYWTGESSMGARWFIDILIERAEALNLKMTRPEQSVVLDLTAFATAVLTNYRNCEPDIDPEEES